MYFMKIFGKTKHENLCYVSIDGKRLTMYPYFYKSCALDSTMQTKEMNDMHVCIVKAYEW